VVAAFSIALADPVSPVAVTKVDTPDPVASGAEPTATITIAKHGRREGHQRRAVGSLNGVGGIGNPPQLKVDQHWRSCQQNVNP
jgi:hypothetical protein